MRWSRLFSIFVAVASTSAARVANDDVARCKTFPGDAQWPSTDDWNSFNKSLGGALIKTVPLAAPCHEGPYYDSAKCAVVQTAFYNSTSHMNDPASIMSPWTEGDTCLPTNDSSTPCTLGGYAVYAVNATTVKHIQLAVNFARETNLRLVIKNTGHDFLGKSTGAGSLGVWTHNLKEFKYLDQYVSGNYTGPAARVGAGLQTFEMIDHMATTNSTFIVAGGTTVGAVGGYAQGGGHSIVTPLWGLGADQLLAVDVVTADGTFIHATPQNNSDILWAMSGGGGGTYGILVSAIVKAHPAIPITSASIYFETSTNVSTTSYWKAIERLFEYSPKLLDQKIYGLVILRSSSGPQIHIKKRSVADANYTASIGVIYPNRTDQEAKNLLSPFITELQSIGVQPLIDWNSGPDYYTYFHQRQYVGDSVGNARHISRLIPRKNLEDGALFTKTFSAIKDSVIAGYVLLADIVSPNSEVAGYPDNAVLPAWRTAASHATFIDVLGFNYTAQSLQASHEAFEKQLQPLRDVTAGSGAYLNEADLQEPNWQESFYGVNYKRLLSIKKKYDPTSVFYATTAVGSEEWKVITADGTPTQNGRLCRV